MSKHARPPRIVGLAVADGMLLCAAGLAIVATQVAPHPAAAERFTTAPEASEPIAHGGPLAVPSIGVVAESPSEVLETTTDPLSRPVPSAVRRTHVASVPAPRAAREAHAAITTPSSADPTPTVAEATPDVTATLSETTTAATTTEITVTATTATGTTTSTTEPATTMSTGADNPLETFIGDPLSTEEPTP